MADACPDRYRAPVVLDAGTGLRQGESFGPTVDRVDFLHRQVRVNRPVVGALDPGETRAVFGVWLSERIVQDHDVFVLAVVD